MGRFSVDGFSEPGLLQLRLEGSLSVDDMRAFCIAHNAAVDLYNGEDYRVFCDLRALRPLSPECAAVFEEAKRYSAARANFRGSAVLVRSQVVALQHKRTSVEGGVIESELISESESECRAHLARVYRVSGTGS